LAYGYARGNILLDLSLRADVRRTDRADPHGQADFGERCEGGARCRLPCSRRLLPVSLGWWSESRVAGQARYPGSGDSSIGAIPAYVLSIGGRHDLTVTVSMERNLTRRETTLSFGGGYAISFQGGDFWGSVLLRGPHL
jgi:hypothetical protein